MSCLSISTAFSYFLLGKEEIFVDISSSFAIVINQSKEKFEKSQFVHDGRERELLFASTENRLNSKMSEKFTVDRMLSSELTNHIIVVDAHFPWDVRIVNDLMCLSFEQTSQMSRLMLFLCLLFLVFLHFGAKCECVRVHMLSYLIEYKIIVFAQRKKHANTSVSQLHTIAQNGRIKMEHPW